MAGRWRPRLLAALAGAIAGFAVGILVNVVWPNPVYGYQLIADGLAVILVLIVAVLPPARRLLPAAVGVAVGVIAGVAIGQAAIAQPFAGVEGSVDLVLERPAATSLTSTATCLVVAGRLELLFTPDGGEELAFDDGPRLVIAISTGGGQPVGAAPRPDGIGFELRVLSTLPDGSPTETRMGSDPTSRLTMSGTGAAGSLAFAGLVLHPQSEQRDPVDVTGTVAWRCPPGP